MRAPGLISTVLGTLIGGSMAFGQSTCGSVQLQLTPDYTFAIGSSGGGSTYTLYDGGQAVAQGSETQLALFHYDGSLTGTSGLLPSQAQNTSFVPGKFGSALAIGTGGLLSYPAAGNVSFGDGTIELWIAPTRNGTDPIYSQYDHTLFRYLTPGGDQLVLSESADGGFYAGTAVGQAFAGVAGIQMSSLQAGVWHHVAFTYSTANARMRLYLDGALVSESDGSFAMPAATGSVFTIDSDVYGNAGAFLVDELRISAVEESATQIQYDATRSTPFANDEVLIPLAGAAPGQLSYSVSGCGSVSYSFTGIPITTLNPQSNLLPPGSTSFNLSFNTLQPASCAYSVGSLLPFGAMQPIATGQQTTAHQGAIGGISSSPLDLNTVYLQCDSNPDYVQTLQYRTVAASSAPFPRIGNIWQGEYMLTNAPAQAEKLQVYFGPYGMTPGQAQAIRSANPNVLILPSINAQETTNGAPVVPSSYLLKDVNGNPIEDWPGDFLLNLTNPEVAAFLAQYAFQQCLIQSSLAFDGVFWDNFNTSIPQPYYDVNGVAHQIDSNGDGIADDPAVLNAAWSKGMNSLIGAFTTLAPYAYVTGHGVQPMPANFASFNGNAFTADAPYVREGVESFGTMMSNYNAWFASGRTPGISTIQSAPPSQIAYGYGYNPLQYVSPSVLQFAQTYYPNMRFGLATALMNDGYSIFDFGDSGVPVDWWYDEYGFNLGQPVDAAAPIASATGTSELSNGGFEQDLSGWQLVVTSDGAASATAAIDQTIAANGAASAAIHVISPGTIQWHVAFEQGNLALAAGTNYQVQFWARSDSARSITVYSQGGAPNYASYGLNSSFSLTTTWQFFTATFQAPVTAADGQLEFFVGDVAGNVWFDDVALFPIAAPIYWRDYTNGAVLLNGTPARQTVAVPAGFTRFSGGQAPLWQYMVDDADSGFTADSSWQVVTYDTGQYNDGGNYSPPFYHAWNSKAHLQNTAGTAAQWNLNIPADGQYTISAWLPAAPGASGWTTGAIYEVVSNGATIATVTIDQTTAAAGDGWHTIGTVSLTVAGAPFLRVHNGGTGALLADAIYVTSAALFNDGSPATQVTLGPYDGILLQRQSPLAPPTSHVDSVANAAGLQPAIASGGFVAINGSGFGTGAITWNASDFVGSALPTSLNQTAATINGVPGYVEYISPTRVIVLAPDDGVVGPVTVQVQTPAGSNYSATVLKQKFAPALFNYQSGSQTYAMAVHLDGAMVGPLGPSSRPAVPGEVIELYGTGFGQTSPPTATAQVVTTPAQLAMPVTVSIGGVNTTVQWAGLTSSGLYMLNVVVPAVAAGDQMLQATISGFQSPAGIFVSVGGN